MSMCRMMMSSSSSSSSSSHAVSSVSSKNSESREKISLFGRMSTRGKVNKLIDWRYSRPLLTHYPNLPGHCMGKRVHRSDRKLPFWCPMYWTASTSPLPVKWPIYSKQETIIGIDGKLHIVKYIQIFLSLFNCIWLINSGLYATFTKLNFRLGESFNNKMKRFWSCLTLILI